MAHARQFESMFIYFHVDVHKWAVCQIADSCNLNRRISSLMEILHVGSLSYKLHLDINDMIDMDFPLSETIDSIHKTMNGCNSKLKNLATQQNITDLSPVKMVIQDGQASLIC